VGRRESKAMTDRGVIDNVEDTLRVPCLISSLLAPREVGQPQIRATRCIGTEWRSQRRIDQLSSRGARRLLKERLRESH
jgi:hypothetical protein